jgi:hypothetical protein
MNSGSASAKPAGTTKFPVATKVRSSARSAASGLTSNWPGAGGFELGDAAGTAGEAWVVA